MEWRLFFSLRMLFEDRSGMYLGTYYTNRGEMFLNRDLSHTQGDVFKQSHIQNGSSLTSASLFWDQILLSELSVLLQSHCC